MGMQYSLLNITWAFRHEYIYIHISSRPIYIYIYIYMVSPPKIHCFWGMNEYGRRIC